METQVKLPKNKVITVNPIFENLPLELENGSSIDDWIAYFEMLKSRGYLSFNVDYEEGYYDSINIVFSVQRRETDEEAAKRKASEERDKQRKENNEREQYEKLKAKFG